MLRIVAPVKEPMRSADRVAKLQALFALIDAARLTADTIEIDDPLTKRELLDSLAVAEISILRLIEEEG
jgi:hypothetical protein